LNVPSNSNENFKFETITLNYEIPTTEAVLFLNIYNLVNIVGIETESTRLTKFKEKFIGFCSPLPLNTTNFIVHDISSNLEYPLPKLICSKNCLIFFFTILFLLIYFFVYLHMNMWICMWIQHGVPP
jgi:hypothetical protein